jgi:UDPglucose 6-dehydrogenase
MVTYRIAVLEMGYVGFTSGMALAKHGFKTICTTTTPTKAENLNRGIPPFYEPQLEELVKEEVERGMLSGSTDNVAAVRESDITFISVGTPPKIDGSADLSAVEAVSRDIGLALKDVEPYHVVVARAMMGFGSGEVW